MKLLQLLTMFLGKATKFLNLYEGVIALVREFRKLWERFKKYWDKTPDSDEEKAESEECWRLVEIAIAVIIVILLATGTIIL